MPMKSSDYKGHLSVKEYHSSFAHLIAFNNRPPVCRGISKEERHPSI
jgi:hypothetical protein